METKDVLKNTKSVVDLSSLPPGSRSYKDAAASLADELNHQRDMERELLRQQVQTSIEMLKVAVNQGQLTISLMKNLEKALERRPALPSNGAADKAQLEAGESPFKGE